MYEKLNLKAWPFQVVPDEDFARIWAGRKQTKLQIDQLVRKMQLTPKSSLHLLWANFGMGKTHTLLHLRHLCQQTKNALIPIYVVMPNRPAGFIDLYRVIVSAFPFELLTDQLIKISSSSAGGLAQHPLFSRSPGIVNALLAYRSGDLERMIISKQWLIAQPGLTSRELSSIGVTYRIKTPEDAINALTVLTRLATYSVKTTSKLVVMIDEYQRIGELKPQFRNDINAGLHSYFNANSNGLEIMLTFAFGRQDNVNFLISPELKSRASPERISLDVLTLDQATEFIRDLLSQFRINPDGRWAFPFSPSAVTRLIDSIAAHKTLTPRRIMQFADHVMLASMQDHGEETFNEISTLEVAQILREIDFSSFDDGEIGV